MEIDWSSSVSNICEIRTLLLIFLFGNVSRVSGTSTLEFPLIQIMAMWTLIAIQGRVYFCDRFVKLTYLLDFEKVG